MIDKQYKFVQYYYLLLNEGQLFEKGTDEFLRTMLETVRAKLKQLEPEYLQAMETEQFSSSENLGMILYLFRFEKGPVFTPPPPLCVIQTLRA